MFIHWPRHRIHNASGTFLLRLFSMLHLCRCQKQFSILHKTGSSERKMTYCLCTYSMLVQISPLFCLSLSHSLSPSLCLWSLLSLRWCINSEEAKGSEGEFSGFISLTYLTYQFITNITQISSKVNIKVIEFTYLMRKIWTDSVEWHKFALKFAENYIMSKYAHHQSIVSVVFHFTKFLESFNQFSYECLQLIVGMMIYILNRIHSYTSHQKMRNSCIYSISLKIMAIARHPHISLW